MNNQSDADKNKTAPLEDDTQVPAENVSHSPPTLSGTLIVPAGGRARRTGDPSQDGGVSLKDVRFIDLVIRGMTERVSLADRTSVTVGRADHKKAALPDVDLSKYGAAQWGVSREHIRLDVRDDQLFMTDLGSTNGTFLRGEQVVAFAPYLIHEGDEIILGRLAVQVVFGQRADTQ
jgi:pSer/pThr/pTyr-binding forkhead associated (FHA) protein